MKNKKSKYEYWMTFFILITTVLFFFVLFPSFKNHNPPLQTNTSEKMVTVDNKTLELTTLRTPETNITLYLTKDQRDRLNLTIRLFVDYRSYIKAHDENLTTQARLFANKTIPKIVDPILQEKLNKLHDNIVSAYSAREVEEFGLAGVLYEVYNVDDLLNPKNVTLVTITGLPNLSVHNNIKNQYPPLNYSIFYFYGVDENSTKEVINSINPEYFQGVSEVDFINTNRKTHSKYIRETNSIILYTNNESEGYVMRLLLHELKHHYCWKNFKDAEIKLTNKCATNSTYLQECLHTGCFRSTPIDDEYGYIQ